MISDSNWSDPKTQRTCPPPCSLWVEKMAAGDSVTIDRGPINRGPINRGPINRALLIGALLTGALLIGPICRALYNRAVLIGRY